MIGEAAEENCSKDWSPRNRELSWVLSAFDRSYRVLLSGIEPCGCCCTVCRSLPFARSFFKPTDCGVLLRCYRLPSSGIERYLHCCNVPGMSQPSLRTKGFVPGATVYDRGLSLHVILVIACWSRGLNLVAAPVQYFATFRSRSAVQLSELRTTTSVNTSHPGVQPLGIVGALKV